VGGFWDNLVIIGAVMLFIWWITGGLAEFIDQNREKR